MAQKTLADATLYDLLMNYAQAYASWLSGPDSAHAANDNLLMVGIQKELKWRIDTLENLQKENEDLRLQLQAAREQLNSAPQWIVGVDPACPKCDDSIIEVNDGNRVVARIKLGSDALEPDAPDGEMKYWFNIATGPYRALDIQAERDFSWSRGPFGSYREADQEWKAYIKRQNANGQP